MAEPARKVAQAEARLDQVARTVREKFDRITESRYAGRPDRPVEPPPTAAGPEDRQDTRSGGGAGTGPKGVGTARIDAGSGRKAGRRGTKPR